MASRNRPRSSFAKDDSGEGELQTLWSSIVDKIKRCQAVRAKYDEVEARKIELENEMKADTLSPKESASKLEELEKLYREGLRLAEEEMSILSEEPEDLIRNLDTLIQVKTALDADVPKPTLNTKSRNTKRKLEPEASADSPILTPETATPSQAAGRTLSKGVSRSGSVAAASVKSENSGEGPETAKNGSTVKEGKMVVGSYVLHRKKNSDGVGILCRVTKVTGDGKQRRYEVQDVEADDNTFDRVSGKDLLPVPNENETLADIPKGTQVVAVYPDTTTFYKAVVVGSREKGGKYRLRFEGEEEKNKEQEVVRHLVLDKS